MTKVQTKKLQSVNLFLVNRHTKRSKKNLKSLTGSCHILKTETKISKQLSASCFENTSRKKILTNVISTIVDDVWQFFQNLKKLINTQILQPQTTKSNVPSPHTFQSVHQKSSRKSLQMMANCHHNVSMLIIRPLGLTSAIPLFHSITSCAESRTWNCWLVTLGRHLKRLQHILHRNSNRKQMVFCMISQSNSSHLDTQTERGTMDGVKHISVGTAAINRRMAYSCSWIKQQSMPRQIVARRRQQVVVKKSSLSSPNFTLA